MPSITSRKRERSGEDIVPDTAKRAVLTIPEPETLGGSVTVDDLCDDYLTHVQGRLDLFKDQRNSPQRFGLIRAAFGSRPTASLRPWGIKDWLSSVKQRSTRGDERVTPARLKPGLLKRLKAHLLAIYQYGKLRDKAQVNPARDMKQRR